MRELSRLDKARAANAAIKAIRAENVELTQTVRTFEQELIDTRSNAREIPKDGDAWYKDRLYTQGMTATFGGLTWVALKWSLGKQPDISPEHWEVEKKAELPTWDSLPEGQPVLEGVRVMHCGAEWVCIMQHIKSTVYKPKDGSTRWEAVA